VAVAQPEPANLARADVDVIRAWQIVVFRAAKESEPIRENFQHPFSVHQAVLADAGAEDLEDQVLLLQADVVDDPLVLGDFVQLVHVHRLQVFDIELAALDLFIFCVGFGVEVGDVFRDGRLAVAARGGLFRLDGSFLDDGLFRHGGFRGLGFAHVGFMGW